jgi:hypothetical protein
MFQHERGQAVSDSRRPSFKSAVELSCADAGRWRAGQRVIERELGVEKIASPTTYPMPNAFSGNFVLRIKSAVLRLTLCGDKK